MSIARAYTDWSATYDTDRNRTRDLDAEICRSQLASLRPRYVVELGCGTGKNTAFLATIAGRVLALDFSEGMLAQARLKVTAPNVAFRVADLIQPWPEETHGADLIVGNLVLEHIEDLRSVFAQAAQSLAPGGRLFFSELHPFRQYQGTQAHFQRDGQTAPITAFQHHVSDYLHSSQAAGLVLEDLGEWWHAEDAGKPPRLLTVLCRKPSAQGPS